VQIAGKRFEIIELGADMAVNADAVAVRVVDASLQGAEQTAAPWNSKDHAVQFA
jgi:hypothetical protein